MDLDEAIRRLAGDTDAPPLARRLAQHAVVTQERQLWVGLPGVGVREVQVSDVLVLMLAAADGHATPAVVGTAMEGQAPPPARGVARWLSSGETPGRWSTRHRYATTTS